MKIFIHGLGKSGIAAEKLARSLGANVITHDDNGVNASFDGADLFIISPGIPNTNPLVVQAKKQGITIVSELEFASMYVNKPIIAVTGTNGKTTVTSLINHILINSGIKSVAAGNIGLPLSEVAINIDSYDVIVLEVSSFQLDYIQTFKPDIAIILNITPDHLDRYKDFEDYKQSKLNLTKNLGQDDLLIVDSFDYRTKNKGFNIVNFKTTEDFSEYSSLKGNHNVDNIKAVVCALKHFGVSIDEIKLGLASFKPLENRMEFVKTVNGVDFVNDSKATNIDSLACALKSYDNVLLVAGGQGKGIDFSPLHDFIETKTKAVVLIGESAGHMGALWKDITRVEYADSMEHAVDVASGLAEAGDVVLLSPGCASFDMFNDYKHRGGCFKEAVSVLV